MSGTISLGTTEVSIGEADGIVDVPIVRTGDLSGTATIQYGTTANTATAGADYIETSGTITMAAGVDHVVVPVKIVNDSLSEPTETFTFSIINVDTGSTLLAPRTSKIDILDDENPVVPVQDPPLVSFYNVTEQPIIQGLNQPIGFEFSPANPSIVYIGEKDGRLKVFDLNANKFLPDFVDLTAQVNTVQDRGLLDIALHPDFIHNPYIYAFYVVDPSDTAGKTGNAGPDGGGNRFSYVERFTANAATNYTTLVPGSGVIIEGGAGQSLNNISGAGAVDSTSDFNQAESGKNPDGTYVANYLKVDSRSHAGGSLEFGPDGALYISTGDGTSFNGVDARSLSVQDINSLSGKILRVDPMTGLGLPDNPFFQSNDSGAANRDKVYQLGLRNPFSMAFDQNGRLFIAAVGWNSWEAIDSGPPGANFGWPYFEGGDNGVLLKTPQYQDLSSAANFYTAVQNGTIQVTSPFRAFSHVAADPGFENHVITAGDVIYTGSRYPAEFQNDFFFTDFSAANVFVVDVNDRRDLSFLYQSSGLPAHFTQGPDGYVYYSDLANGVIGRLLIEPSLTGVTLAVGGNATHDSASDIYTLTPDAGGQKGTAMSTARIDLTHDFTISFQAYLGTKDGGADGLAFVLQNDPAGSSAIGIGGSGMAIAGIHNGLAVEFDTYANPTGQIVSGGPDIAQDHTDFLDTDGSFGTTPFALPNIEDGQWHKVGVNWNAATQTLSYTFDDQQAGTLNANIVSTYLGGSNFAYFGVGAGTGGLSNEQKVRFTSVNAIFEGGQVPVLAVGGNATHDSASDIYTLTPDAGGQKGTAMSTARIDLTDDFTISFQAYLGTKDGGADGLAFVLQNDPAGSSASGIGGSGMAIAGIHNGLAIEFDTYANPTGQIASGGPDIAQDHTDFLDTDGSFGTTPFALPNIEDGQWHNVEVNWNAATQTLSYTFDGQQVGTLNANIVSTYLGGSNFAYFGFGAGTGGLSNEQKVRVTSVNATYEGQGQVPVLAIGGNATHDSASDIYTLTPDAGGQKGTAMSTARIDLTHDFTISFQAYLGTKDGGADGLAFVLQNDPAGSSASGIGGSGMAIAGIHNGLAIEFDTYANSTGQIVSGGPDIAQDHTDFLDTDGSFGTTPFALPNIEDGQWHNVGVSWNAATQTLSYTFDGQQAGTLNANIVSTYLGGSNFAYFGFGAGTGGLSNEQKVRVTSVNATYEVLAPAGVAGEGINLGLTNPPDHVGAITVTISGIPSGWTLSDGTANGDGTWTIQSADISALSITSAANYAGAVSLDVTTSWTGANGGTGHSTISDNVEVFAPGNSIFALSGDDHLTGSSGGDLFVCAQPIGHDVIHTFDPAHDQIDLIAYTSFTSFGDVQAHMADDGNGNAVITIGDGQSITIDGVNAAALTASNFVFDLTPVTDNAGDMTVGNGAVLPLSGIIDNTGTIALNSSGGGAELELIEHGITLQGDGRLVLSDDSKNVVTGTSGDVTLTNVDNTISGAGQLGEGQMTLVNEGTIDATGTNALVLDTGSNVITNSGILEATGTGGLKVNSAVVNSGSLLADGGNLTFNGAVTGNGTATISGAATLEFAAASSETVNFAAGSTGTLKLDNSALFTGSVSGLTTTTYIDLADLAWVPGQMTATFSGDTSGGQLTVSDGTQSDTINLVGDYTESGWTLSQDSNGGTLVVDPPLSSVGNVPQSTLVASPIAILSQIEAILGAQAQPLPSSFGPGSLPPQARMDSVPPMSGLLPNGRPFPGQTPDGINAFLTKLRDAIEAHDPTVPKDIAQAEDEDLDLDNARGLGSGATNEFKELAELEKATSDLHIDSIMGGVPANMLAATPNMGGAGTTSPAVAGALDKLIGLGDPSPDGINAFLTKLRDTIEAHDPMLAAATLNAGGAGDKSTMLLAQYAAAGFQSGFASGVGAYASTPILETIFGETPLLTKPTT